MSRPSQIGIGRLGKSLLIESFTRTRSLRSSKPLWNHNPYARHSICQAPLAISVTRPYADQAGSALLRRTSLYDFHVENGAKIVPFGGYSMPLHYTDLNHVESHHWTRSKASLFDVSHMCVAMPSFQVRTFVDKGSGSNTKYLDQAQRRF